ncbi:MAG: GNAT family N-acetyltransferase [Defluviitaleaceae bacterium]|nr:GNAT family N-acetyltransferase [Defluviitaleaceae bacterium]
MQIIPFLEKYTDDAIFCILLAKEALGREPRFNRDMLDISANYFDRGDMFWLALNENDRVIGMIGTHSISDTDMWLKRLFIKPGHLRQGLASALLARAEDFAQTKGVTTIHTGFNAEYTAAPKFYAAKGFAETAMENGRRHFVKNI